MSLQASQNVPVGHSADNKSMEPGEKSHVRFKAFSVIRDVMGAEMVDVVISRPGTVESVQNALLERFGEDLREKLWDREAGEMTPFLIRLNDEIIRSTSDMDRSVEDGDEIAFIFPIGGG
jgi:molybdopterin converting factor small subunit